MIFKTAAFASTLLLGSAHKLKMASPYETVQYEEPVVREKQDHIRIPPAEAINMTEPRYFCTRPGYVLHGHKCILTERAPIQFICPPGFERIDGRHKCSRSVPALFHCPRGVLRGDVCEVKHFSPVVSYCPEGYHETHDGKCRDTKPVDLVPECRGDARLANGKCVEFRFSSPEYVCPPNSVQDGKKCREEEELVLTDGKKMKFRKLEAEEMQLEGEEELEGEGEGGEAAVVEAEGWNEEKTETRDGGKLKVKYAKVPIAVQKQVVVKTKQIKVKIPKERKPNVKTVLKVKLFNAEKVCEVGIPSGKNCVEEVPSAPEYVCPVPRIEGECVREKFVSPNMKCKEHNAVLHCGEGRYKDEICRCETIERFPANPYCPDGGELKHDVCIYKADALETCPLGFKFDHLKRECIAVTIEEAECEFMVTYLCADCDKSRPEFKEIYFHK